MNVSENAPACVFLFLYVLSLSLALLSLRSLRHPPFGSVLARFRFCSHFASFRFAHFVFEGFRSNFSFFQISLQQRRAKKYVNPSIPKDKKCFLRFSFTTN